MPRKSRLLFVCVFMVGLFSLLPRLEAGETWTCPKCGKTWNFPSNHGGQLQAFAARHTAACRAGPPPPPPPPPPDYASIRLQQALKIIDETNSLIRERNDIVARLTRTESEVLGATGALSDQQGLYTLMKEERKRTSNLKADMERIRSTVTSMTQAFDAMVEGARP